MTDRIMPVKSNSQLSSSSLHAQDSAYSTIRPRNRRLISTEDGDARNQNPSGMFPAINSSSSMPPPKSSRSNITRTQTNNKPGTDYGGGNGSLGQFLNESWTQSWASIHGFTSSLVTGDAVGKGGGLGSLSNSRSSSRPSSRSRSRHAASGSPSKTWGPAPPSDRPGLDEVTTGSLLRRETALKAARTASVLESHDGVNGGLDITGKHKRRMSDDIHAQHQPVADDYLVYVHQVQPNDTYAGIVLRYRCREDAFRQANGLWSRDSLQTRKWLTIPVDACEIRGRACDPPSSMKRETTDLLAPTPQAVEEKKGHGIGSEDFFAHQAEEFNNLENREEEDRPWTHVRWVKMDSFQSPIEIGRVPRTAMGYFPPRRRKSQRTLSTVSTPRQSMDFSGAVPGSLEGSLPRRLSNLSVKPPIPGTPMSSRSRGGSETEDARPAWMRRPGGVGSMGKSVRAPGPDRDYFNTWTKNYLPGLNIDTLPSMSIMGSEQARFGFAKESSDIAESSHEEGRDAASLNRQGTGLDKAAAAVETWLRGALAKAPSTPLLSGRGRTGGKTVGDGDGDLIELTDTGSDDGRFLLDSTSSLLGSTSLGASSRSNGDGAGGMRGRVISSTMKDKKAD